VDLNCDYENRLEHDGIPIDDLRISRPRKTLFVTTFPLHHQALGGGAWADRRVLEQLTAAGLSPSVFPVATLEPGSDSVKLEVRNDKLALFRVATRMLHSGSPYLVAKFEGTRAWKLRARRLQQEADGRNVVASQFPSLMLCEAAGIEPDVYVAQNVDSVLARSHNPRLLEIWGDSRRLERIESTLLRQVRAVAAMSKTDAIRLRSINPRAVHIPLLSRSLPLKPRTQGRRVGLLGKLSWPPNQRAVNILLNDVMPLVRGEMGETAPEFVIGGRGTERMRPRKGVQLLGELEDIDEFYGRISLVVVPRLGVSTGISVKMLEAIERGVPVIAPGSLAEAAGVRGRVIEADTAPETVAAIVAFFQQLDKGNLPEFAPIQDGISISWPDFIGLQ
jgi:glycosyltransferase involved in cell wall biosynthesis